MNILEQSKGYLFQFPAADAHVVYDQHAVSLASETVISE